MKPRALKKTGSINYLGQSAKQFCQLFFQCEDCLVGILSNERINLFIDTWLVHEWWGTLMFLVHWLWSVRLMWKLSLTFLFLQMVNLLREKLFVWIKVCFHARQHLRYCCNIKLMSADQSCSIFCKDVYYFRRLLGK